MCIATFLPSFLDKNYFSKNRFMTLARARARAFECLLQDGKVRRL